MKIYNTLLLLLLMAFIAYLQTANSKSNKEANVKRRGEHGTQGLRKKTHTYRNPKEKNVPTEKKSFDSASIIQPMKTTFVAAASGVSKVFVDMDVSGKLQGNYNKGKSYLASATEKLINDTMDLDEKMTKKWNDLTREFDKELQSGREQLAERIEKEDQKLNKTLVDIGQKYGNKKKETKAYLQDQFSKEKRRKTFKTIGLKSLEGSANAAEGVLALVNGIKAGKWLDAVAGALAMMSAVAAVLGPFGPLVSAVLSILSVIFSIFGGIFGGEESTEDIIKRVLEKALKEAQADELRAEGAGLKKVYGQVSRTIARFKEKNNVTPEEALKLYDFAFKGVKFFGILENYITRDCNVSNPKSYDTDQKKAELKKKAERCLEFVNLFCDLSIARQMLMVELICFIEQLIGVKKEDSIADGFSRSTETNELSEEQKKALNSTRNNLAKLISYERHSDMKFLTFMYDPINYPDNRYVVAKYASAPEKYSTIGKYLKKLDELYTDTFGEDAAVQLPVLSVTTKKKRLFGFIEDATPRLLNDFVIYCTDVGLMGSCREDPRIGNITSEGMKGWDKGAIKSVYLTANRKWTGFMGTNTDESKIGPFYGPGIFSIPDSEFKVHSALIEVSEVDSSSMLKVCAKDDLDMTGECMHYEPGSYPNLEQEDNEATSKKYRNETGNTYYPCKIPFYYNGKHHHCTTAGNYDPWCHYDGTYWAYCFVPNRWKNKIKSFSLPQGLKLVPYQAPFAQSDKEKRKKDSENNKKTYYGPLTTTLPSAAANKWQSMILEKTDSTLNSFVKICQGESLTGYCTQLVPPENKGWKVFTDHLKDLQGVDWTEDANKIQSLEIPGGISVEIKTKNEQQGIPYGPYFGPVKITKIDGSDKTMKMINITRLY